VILHQDFEYGPKKIGRVGSRIAKPKQQSLFSVILRSAATKDPGLDCRMGGKGWDPSALRASG